MNPLTTPTCTLRVAVMNSIFMSPAYPALTIREADWKIVLIRQIKHGDSGRGKAEGVGKSCIDDTFNRYIGTSRQTKRYGQKRVPVFYSASHHGATRFIMPPSDAATPYPMRIPNKRAFGFF